MMDFYTKAVLTVIAAALSVLAIENAGGRAVAAGGITKVAICADNNPDVCASVGYDTTLGN